MTPPVYRLRSRVHGHVHEDESLVNLPNWLVLRWGADQDRWVDPAGPGISEYRQTLDLGAAVLHRRYRHAVLPGPLLRRLLDVGDLPSACDGLEECAR